MIFFTVFGSVTKTMILCIFGHTFYDELIGKDVRFLTILYIRDLNLLCKKNFNHSQY